jgi:nicotinamidase-related amidase
MPLDLAAVVAPGHTALLTVEVQDNVVGESSMLPELARAATAMVPNIAALAGAARSAGIPVVHCTAVTRPDRLGSSTNARLFAATSKLRPPGPPGPAPPAVLHRGLGAQPGDLVMPRLHGLSPLSDSGLDSALRNMAITTIVVTGVSVNVAVLATVIEGVNRGYQVVLPRDAVAGVGKEYVDSVVDNTIALLATVTTTTDVLDLWSR